MWNVYYKGVLISEFETEEEAVEFVIAIYGINAYNGREVTVEMETI